ncbi:MAG: hypothetical protein FJ125_07485 [Deltaproteobacteria bacterium]|nr:hypothetical protein [Deltaproteobacteria bacterium]
MFRRLSEAGYLSSYSHAGRFYTLSEIPQFDEHGLWAYGDALFSRHGTLRVTIVHMVEGAVAGHTHKELHLRLRLRVHDTLHDLVEEQKIGRAEVAGRYLYVCVDEEKAAAQVARRQQQETAVASQPQVLPPPQAVIEVLIGLLHHPGEDAAGLVSLLQKQGRSVTASEVEAVLAHYDVGKKKPASRRLRG